MYDSSLKILRSMLYRGSEITREVAWVIFDEIHYLRDKGRTVYLMIKRDTYAFVGFFRCQSVVSSGRRRSFSYLTMFIMCSSRRPFPTLNSLLNGSRFFTIKYEQYCHKEYFISIVVAVPCRLHRYSTRTSPSLHLSCRCRWSSFGGG